MLDTEQTYLLLRKVNIFHKVVIIDDGIFIGVLVIIIYYSTIPLIIVRPVHLYTKIKKVVEAKENRE